MVCTPTSFAQGASRRCRLLTLRWRFVVALLALTLLAWGTAQQVRSPILERIEADGTLRVCIWPDYFSMSWRNPRTGELEGIDIDMAYALAERLGVDVTFVDSSFAQLIDNMEARTCDIAMHGVGIRESRIPHMAFSDPYVASDIYAVAEASNDRIDDWDDIDVPGNVVVAQRGTLMELEFQDRLEEATLLVVDEFLAREQAVQSGRGDVFLTDYPYALRMERLNAWAKIIEPDTPIAITPYAYAVPLGDPAWLAEVNAFLADVRADGRLEAAAERHGLLPILIRE